MAKGVDRRGFFKMLRGKGRKRRPGPVESQSPKDCVFSLGLGGWLEVRGDELVKTGLGDLVSFFEDVDLAVVMLGLGPGGRAGPVLANAGINAAIFADAPEPSVKEELLGYRVETLSPGDCLERAGVAAGVVLFAAGAEGGAGMEQALERARAFGGVSVCVVPKTAWPLVPDKRSRQAAETAAERGADVVLVGPAAPFAGVVDINGCIAVFGLGHLWAPFELPGQDTSVLLELGVGNKEDQVVWRLVHAKRGTKGRPPVLLSGADAEQASERAAGMSRKAFGEASLL